MLKQYQGENDHYQRWILCQILSRRYLTVDEEHERGKSLCPRIWPTDYPSTGHLVTDVQTFMRDRARKRDAKSIRQNTMLLGPPLARGLLPLRDHCPEFYIPLLFFWHVISDQAPYSAPRTWPRRRHRWLKNCVSGGSSGFDANDVGLRVVRLGLPNTDTL